MRIGCGCVNLGTGSSGATWSEHIRLVRSAVDAGVTAFDTADAYGSGASERILGAALRGRRDDVVIATKGGYVVRDRSRVELVLRRLVGVYSTRARRARVPSRPFNAPSGSASSSSHYAAQDFTPQHLRSALDASLRRLGTDYVDVYQLHGPPAVMPELLDTLVDLRVAGKVREFGVGSESIESAVAWATVTGVGVLQLPFGVLDPGAVDDVFPLITPGATEIWARGVLAGGILSKAMADPLSIADHPKCDVVAELAVVAARAGIGLDELAVRWVQRHSAVTTVLLGMSSAKHLARNVELASRPALDDEIVAQIATVVGGLA